MRISSACLGALFVLVVAACGGSGSTPTAPVAPAPTPVPTPEPAPRIEYGFQNNTMTIRSSSRVGNLELICADFHSELNVAETAGGWASLRQVDAWIQTLEGDIEGRRLTDVTNTNLQRSSSRLTFDRSGGYCGYIGRDYPPTMRVVLHFIDRQQAAFTVNTEGGFERR